MGLSPVKTGLGVWLLWVGAYIEGGDTLLHAMIIPPVVMFYTPFLNDLWDFHIVDVYPLELFIKNVVHTRIIPAAFFSGWSLISHCFCSIICDGN